MNLAIYDNAIGRNSNFRHHDYTSVWKYRDPMEYILRLSQPDGDSALDKLNSQNKIFPMMIHNGLWHANIWLKAFPCVKIIHMSRNPVDIVYSWIGKGYGENFFSSNRAAIVTYKYKDATLPYFAYGWEEKYLTLNKVDRIIYMINHIRNCHHDTYKRLKNIDKKKILFMNHQNLITKTDKCLKIIEDFIGEGPSIDTPSVLLEQNCPRSADVKTPFATSRKGFEEKLIEIKKLTSTNSFNILMDMNNQFKSTEPII